MKTPQMYFLFHPFSESFSFVFTSYHKVLSLLLALPEAGTAFLALQSEFVAAACSDDFIAEVVCNKALPMQQDLRARLAYSAQQQAQLEQQFAADASQQQAMQY